LSHIPVIAIVDDAPAVRDALAELLQMSGYACCAFGDAGDFLDDYVPGRFDCLISDVRMPGIGGLELQQRLRALGAQLPIIFITSHADPGIKGMAMDAGARAFLTKPVSEDVLLGTLSETLKTKDV
jgi:FixJ family two-component response regulator